MIEAPTRTTPPTRLRRRTSAAGAALIVLIAVLAITTVLTGAWVGRIVQQRRLQQIRQHHVQARWLADSGVRRAVARWSHDPNYAGETWRIDAKELGGRNSAEVAIRLQPRRAGSEGDRSRIVAEARILASTAAIAQHTKSIPIPPWKQSSP